MERGPLGYRRKRVIRRRIRHLDIWIDVGRDAANERDALDSERELMSVDFHIVFYFVTKIPNVLFRCGPFRKVLPRLDNSAERIVLFRSALWDARIVHCLY
jgi:hypothetical protein